MRLFYFLFILFILFSCKQQKIQATAPVETYQKVQYQAPVSSLYIPIEISVLEIENIINRELNGMLYEDNDFSDKLLMKVWKIQPIKISMDGDKLNYSVAIKVWTKVAWDISYMGLSMSDSYEGECSVNMKFSTQLQLTKYWDVLPRTSLISYEWIEKPLLKTGIGSIPITFIADKIIKSQQQLITTSIDKELEKQLTLRKYLVDAWNVMHQPILLYNAPQTWLRITPNDMSISPLKGDAYYIRTTVRMEGVTETIIGNKPAPISTPLPPLNYSKDERGIFKVSLVNDIEYSELTRIASQYMKGQTFESKNGKKKVTVDSIQLYGTDAEKLVVKTYLSGSLKGIVYLTGKPKYDSINQIVYMDELDYELQTKNILAKSANWLVHSLLIKKMKSALTYSIKEDLIYYKKELEKTLKNYVVNSNVQIQGTIDYIAPKHIYVTPTALKAVVESKGNLKIEIKGLDK